MVDRKLTHQQRLRTDQKQQAKTEKAQGHSRDLSRQTQAGQLGSEQRGLIICRFGKEFDVEALEGDEQGQIHRCLSRTNLGAIVTGDRVIWRAGEGHTGVIESRLPRSSILERPDNFGRLKAVAANIDQLLIVTAVQPPPLANLIDRYLVAAELMQLKPVIILNKMDLMNEQNEAELNQLLLAYESLGYSVSRIISSRHQTPDLADIPALINNHTSIVVGQSGVGKSSLINTLLPEAKLEVGELSSSSGEGTHTTTRAKLFHLPAGGKLIDSPGIREFGLWHIEPDQLQYGYIEIAERVGECRFRNCQHDSEPGCAIHQAVKSGAISEQRFSSFIHTREHIRAQHAKGLGGTL